MKKGKKLNFTRDSGTASFLMPIDADTDGRGATPCLDMGGAPRILRADFIGGEIYGYT